MASFRAAFAALVAFALAAFQVQAVRTKDASLLGGSSLERDTEEAAERAEVELAAGHVLRDRYELHSFLRRVRLATRREADNRGRLRALADPTSDSDVFHSFDEATSSDVRSEDFHSIKEATSSEVGGEEYYSFDPSKAIFGDRPDYPSMGDLGNQLNGFGGGPVVAHDYPDYPSMGDAGNQLNGFVGGSHLGTGSFGDVWKAFDKQANEYVAVKIFYKGREYLTKARAKLDPWLTWQLEKSKEECQKTINIVNMGSVYPEGVGHICKCKAEHISDAGLYDPIFLVQEMCGTSLAEILQRKEVFSKAYVRQIMTGILNGLAFLNRLDPPQVHHDLKPENVVVSDSGVAKIIDFGAMVPFNAAGQAQHIACTPSYAPPEGAHCPRPPNFSLQDGKPWSFDAWAAGKIYWELNCHVRWLKIPADAKCPDDSKLGATGSGSATDLQVIAGLMQTDPASRTEPAVAAEQLAQP